MSCTRNAGFKLLADSLTGVRLREGALWSVQGFPCRVGEGLSRHAEASSSYGLLPAVSGELCAELVAFGMALRLFQSGQRTPA